MTSERGRQQRSGERTPPRPEGPQDEGITASSVAVSVFALVAAGAVSLTAGGPLGEYASMIWLLGLLPVFLLA